MVTAKEPVRCKLVVRNRPMKQVTGEDYLEIKIFVYRKIGEEVKHQVTKTNKRANITQ